MRSTVRSLLVSIAVLSPMSSVLKAQDRLPGDRGRPAGNGVQSVQPSTTPPGGMPRATVRAPSIDLAVQAARAIAKACKQYPLGVAVVNAEGAPTLIYIPDGTDPHHGYTALRKAYTAIMFKVNTSQLVAKAQQDAEFAAKIKADPNLLAFSGGLILKAGENIIGAIGVSGAEPGRHDEECGLAGLEKIRNQLK